MSVDSEVEWADFEFLLLYDCLDDVAEGYVELEAIYSVEIDGNGNTTCFRVPAGLDVIDDIPEEGLFYTAFDHSGSGDVVFAVQVAGNDGRTDNLRSVDDFLDSRHTLCDTHSGDTSKMEGLQSHLCSGFSD